MHDKLLTMLIDNGLVQFGRFDRDGAIVPMLLNFDLLPSYPDTLSYIVEQAAGQISADVERIVCAADSVPLGVGLSLKTQIPLVYSRGRGEAPVHDLVGAYDVGHPAALVINVLEDMEKVQHFIGQAEKVGLHIHFVFAITNLNEHQPKDFEISVLMPFGMMLDEMERSGAVTGGQVNAVRQWIAR